MNVPVPWNSPKLPSLVVPSVTFYCRSEATLWGNITGTWGWLLLLKKIKIGNHPKFKQSQYLLYLMLNLECDMANINVIKFFFDDESHLCNTRLLGFNDLFLCQPWVWHVQVSQLLTNIVRSQHCLFRLQGDSDRWFIFRNRRGNRKQWL